MKKENELNFGEIRAEVRKFLNICQEIDNKIENNSNPSIMDYDRAISDYQIDLDKAKQLNIPIICKMVEDRIKINEKNNLNCQENTKLESNQKKKEHLSNLLDEAYRMIELFNYKDAIKNLDYVKKEADQYEIIEISELADKYIKQARSENLKPQIIQIHKLIERGNYEEAITFLEKLKIEANRYDLSDISELTNNLIKQANMFKKFLRMVKASNKIKVNDMCEHLERSRKEILDMIFELSDKFGIKLDGDYVLIENSEHLDTMIFDLLGNSFIDWKEKEKTKQGKI